MTEEKIASPLPPLDSHLGCQSTLLSVQLKLELGAQREKAFWLETGCQARLWGFGSLGLALARNPIVAAANTIIGMWWQKGALGQGQRTSSGTNLSRAKMRANGDGGLDPGLQGAV